MRRITAIAAASAAVGGIASALVIALPSGAGPVSAGMTSAGTGKTRVLATYRVFRENSHGVFALPPQAQRLERALITDGPGIAPDVRTGQPVPGSERLLFSNAGTISADVFGVAMSAGRACLLIPGIAAGCDRGALQTDPVAWLSGGPEGGPGIIAGLARDGVRAVDIVVAGQTVSASFANNAFYRELSLNDLRHASALEVTMDDGSIVSIDLPALG